MLLKIRLVFAVLLSLAILIGCGAMSPDATVTASAQSVVLGDTVTLSSAGSDKKNGETLTYSWSIVSAPTGSTAQLSNPASAEPTFTPDQIGEYVFQLVVDNDFHRSDPVQAKITCTAAPTKPIVPVVFAADPSGLISLLDFTAVDNFRTAALVNLSLKYTLKNTGTARANISIVVRGFDRFGAEVYFVHLSNAVNAGETKVVAVSLGEVLSVTQFDNIVEWTVDPINVNP